MISLINRIAVLVLIAICFISFVLYHDDMDIVIPYIDHVYTGVAILLGLLFFGKANYRWQAVSIAKKAKLYFVMSKVGMKKAIAYEGVNLGFYIIAAVALLFFSSKGFYVGCVAVLFIIEGIAHLAQNASSVVYRTIVQENAITIINNYVTVIPWKGLKRIESRHDDVRFIDELNKVYLLDLDTINKDEQKDLLEELKRIARKKNLFFDIVVE